MAFPVKAYAAFLIFSSTDSPAFRASAINASILKLLIHPQSRSLRRSWVMSNRFAAAASQGFPSKAVTPSSQADSFSGCCFIISAAVFS
jgi:hypothetical protein